MRRGRRRRRGRERRRRSLKIFSYSLGRHGVDVSAAAWNCSLYQSDFIVFPSLSIILWSISKKNSVRPPTNFFLLTSVLHHLVNQVKKNRSLTSEVFVRQRVDPVLGYLKNIMHSPKLTLSPKLSSLRKYHISDKLQNFHGRVRRLLYNFQLLLNVIL